LNIDIIDVSAVVCRGYTMSGERRIIAIDELENTLKWSWPMKNVIRYGTRLLTTAPLRVMWLV
jgi:hypothetical protein